MSSYENYMGSRKLKCPERLCTENATVHLFQEGAEIGWLCRYHADLACYDYTMRRLQSQAVPQVAR